MIPVCITVGLGSLLSAIVGSNKSQPLDDPPDTMDRSKYLHAVTLFLRDFAGNSRHPELNGLGKRYGFSYDDFKELCTDHPELWEKCQEQAERYFDI